MKVVDCQFKRNNKTSRVTLACLLRIVIQSTNVKTINFFLEVNRYYVNKFNRVSPDVNRLTFLLTSVKITMYIRRKEL